MTLTSKQARNNLIILRLHKRIKEHLCQTYYKPLTRPIYNKYLAQCKRDVDLLYPTQSQNRKEM